ncbi:MAG TPA: FtsQ-type POTRA domain-containing protein [Rhodoplanes sp.]|nr:FtsQ-type POTRA domain-containing protein [Rhodoplanes sp.]
MGRLRRFRTVGGLASVLIVLAGLLYGIFHGGYLPTLVGWFKDGRDMAANAVGFRIAAVAIVGHKHLSREEILAIAGIGGRTSLLFLDAAETRARLKSNPWVGDATVQKLFPDRLAITVTERAAFALWQTDGQINVIADDGTVLELFLSRAVLTLPFVVGAGAATRAKEFLALLDRHPDLRETVRASVLIGERRWNLRLKNGVNVRLPEAGVARALDQLAALDREKNLLARDISLVDLRLPDRVTLRLSESVAQAREEALKAKRSKPKGGSA